MRRDVWAFPVAGEGCVVVVGVVSRPSFSVLAGLDVSCQLWKRWTTGHLPACLTCLTLPR